MVGDALLPHSLSGSLVDHVTILVRGVTRKYKYVAFTMATLTSTQSSLSEVQRYLVVLLLKNAYLAQRLTECSTDTLRDIS